MEVRIRNAILAGFTFVIVVFLFFLPSSHPTWSETAWAMGLAVLAGVLSFAFAPSVRWARRDIAVEYLVFLTIWSLLPFLAQISDTRFWLLGIFALVLAVRVIGRFRGSPGNHIPPAPELGAKLARMIVLLGKYNEPHWHAYFKEAEDLLLAGKVERAKKKIRRAYGGMGSFRDSVCFTGAPPHVAEEGDALSLELYDMSHSTGFFGFLLRVF